jgi:hypothetical protein
MKARLQKQAIELKEIAAFDATAVEALLQAEQQAESDYETE